jgi:hypothetical protein
MGEDMFSSTNTLTQTKIYVIVSNNPAIALDATGAPGKAVCVVESILT